MMKPDLYLKKWPNGSSICGEAVYGTRPFRIYGEGDTRVIIQGFRGIRRSGTPRITDLLPRTEFICIYYESTG
jgi:hypothetical protein